MRKRYILYPLLFVVLFVLMDISTEPYTPFFKGLNARDNTTVFAESNTDDRLYQEIIDYSKRKKIEPIDARVDKVWKAIPGYNGLQVNIKESYKRMIVNGEFDIKRIVIRKCRQMST